MGWRIGLDGGRWRAILLLKLRQKLLSALVGGIDPQHLVERTPVFALVGGDGRQPEPRDLVIRFDLKELPEQLACLAPLAGLGQLNSLVELG